MGFYRLKHSFTSGELSPLMNARVEFERYQNGCKVLRNAYATPQGPATRRPGFKFSYDLNLLGLNSADPQIRMIPFVFNEEQAYVMIFFMHTDGFARMVLATTQEDGTDGLVIFGDPAPTECPPGTPQTYTPGDIVSLTLPADWDNLAMDWAQSADEMWIAQSGLQPHIIKRYSHECWELIEVTFTDQPSDWSDELGWPQKVTFHQQRICLATTLLRRQTVWMSQAGDFSAFGVSVPLVASDAVTFTLDSGTQNKIQWMISGKALNVGTLGNEWTVTGTDSAALTPENILAQRQTNNGSASNKPMLVGLTTLFIERHGRTVNEFMYDLNYDSYKTTDMSILSPHVTDYYSIVDWAYQQTPESIIWCIREDGQLLGLTYQQQHKIIGWHVHDTDGEFKAISVIPGTTREDDVWVVVKRIIDDEDKYYVEILADQFLGSTAIDGRFLDSYLIYDGAATDTLSGAIHLAGKTVDILADGTVHPAVTVELDGTLDLNNSYAHVVIGLPYETEIRPFLMDVTSDRIGTSLGRDQRITSLAIDLYNSLGMWIGRVDPLGLVIEEEQPFRVPSDLMGQAIPLYTGIYTMDYPEGYDRTSDYYIKQKQPLPLTVRGVTDLIEVF